MVLETVPKAKEDRGIYPWRRASFGSDLKSKSYHQPNFTADGWILHLPIQSNSNTLLGFLALQLVKMSHSKVTEILTESTCWSCHSWAWILTIDGCTADFSCDLMLRFHLTWAHFFGADTFSITETFVTEEARDIFCMDLTEKNGVSSHSYNGAEHHKDAHKSNLSSLFEISQV